MSINIGLDKLGRDLDGVYCKFHHFRFLVAGPDQEIYNQVITSLDADDNIISCLLGWLSSDDVSAGLFGFMSVDEEKTVEDIMILHPSISEIFPHPSEHLVKKMYSDVNKCFRVTSHGCSVARPFPSPDKKRPANIPPLEKYGFTYNEEKKTKKVVGKIIGTTIFRHGSNIDKS